MTGKVLAALAVRGTALGSANQRQRLHAAQFAQIELQPATLRVWLGEGLWQAANFSAPPPKE